MAKDIIEATLQIKPNKKERKRWRVKDALLLDPIIQVIGSPMVKSILHGWGVATKTLDFKFTGKHKPYANDRGAFAHAI